MDPGKNHCQEVGRHHMSYESSHAIWQEFCHHWDFLPKDSRCIRPICVDYSLESNKKVTFSIKTLVILVSVLVHTDIPSVFAVTTNTVNVHDSLVSPLICLDQTVKLERFPESRSEHMSDHPWP